MENETNPTKPTEKELFDKFGPIYPALPGLAKFRKSGVLSDEYGHAVLAAIGKLNDRELQGTLAPQRSAPCASGSWANDGHEILAHIGRANLAALQRREQPRIPADEREAYEEAMTRKRKASETIRATETIQVIETIAKRAAKIAKVAKAPKAVKAVKATKSPKAQKVEKAPKVETVAEQAIEVPSNVVPMIMTAGQKAAATKRAKGILSQAAQKAWATRRERMTA